MTQVWYATGHFFQLCLSILVKMGWGPVVLFSVVLFFGMLYWLNLQARYNRRAKERSESI